MFEGRVLTFSSTSGIMITRRRCKIGIMQSELGIMDGGNVKQEKLETEIVSPGCSDVVYVCMNA